MDSDRAWHERRRLSGGASDLPIVLGISPYANASPLVLAWQKRGVLAPDITEIGMDRWIAEEYEAMGRRWLARELGCEVNYEPVRDDFVTHCCTCGASCRLLTEYGAPHTQETAPFPCCEACQDANAAHAHANLDGRVIYEGRELVYEGKVITYGNPEYDSWRRGGIPDAIAWQVQQQLLCSGLPAGLIVVHDAGRAEFGVRVVDADPDRQAFIADVWRKWWTAAVIQGRDPSTPWTDSVLQAIKARWPDSDPARTVSLTQEDFTIVQEWHDDKSIAREAKKRADAARTRLLKRMEDAAVGTFPDGQQLGRRVAKNGRVTLTWRPKQ